MIYSITIFSRRVHRMSGDAGEGGVIFREVFGGGFALRCEAVRATGREVRWTTPVEARGRVTDTIGPWKPPVLAAREGL
jgi:hypothetical protein